MCNLHLMWCEIETADRNVQTLELLSVETSLMKNILFNFIIQAIYNWSVDTIM